MNVEATSHQQPWTIVLAAGEGTRLRSLTRALYGEDLPKQFASIHGGHSLLQNTLERTRCWSDPERTVMVVAKDREPLARAQVASFGSIDVVPQPKNLGTGPGLLLPLMHVMAKDPDALVVIVPSDHYIRDLEPFVQTVKNAVSAARKSDSLVLVGAVPDRAESEYGWIVTQPDGDDAGAAVNRFEEKPAAALAMQLLEAGALWNTFVMVGSAKRIWQLARQHLPGQCALFESYARAVNKPRRYEVLTGLYKRMQPADFSRDVLHRAKALRAVTLEPCGWSDWGTPDRVLDSVRGSDVYNRLVECLSSAQASPVAQSASAAV